MKSGRSILVALAATAAALAAGACGQKGPLVVPGVPAGAPWPYTRPDPARKDAPPAAPATPRHVPDVPGTSEERK